MLDNMYKELVCANVFQLCVCISSLANIEVA